MKKRMLAWLCVTVMTVTVLFSAFGVQAMDTTSEGLYDLYAGAGTYGTESVGTIGMELINNTGDAATAIGGDYGMAVKRPIDNAYSIIMGKTTMGAEVVDPVETSTVTFFSNGVFNADPTRKCSTNAYGFHSTKGTATMGATLVLRERVDFLQMFMYSQEAFDDAGQMKFYVSDKQDGTYREITVKRTTNTEWDGQWTAYVYEPADYTQIQVTDKYLKFVFTKPKTNAEQHSYQIAQVDFVCNNPYIANSIDFTDTSITKLVPYISDNAKITSGSKVNMALSPRATNLRLKATADGDTTMEVIFTSDIDGFDYDIKDIQIHVSHNPDVTFATPKLAVSNTLNGTYEEVDVLTTIEVEADWRKAITYSFADAKAIETESVRYVKFTAVVPDGIQTPHYNVSHFEFLYEPAPVAGSDEVAYAGSIAYRTTNMKTFSAQINFKAGTENEPIVKAYVANTNRSDAYKEVALVRTAGKLEDAPVPTKAGEEEAWVSYVYSRIAGQPVGDYVKIEIILPEDSTVDACQFMGLSYTYDDTNMTVYDVKENRDHKPVRHDGYINVKNPVPEAVGGTRSWQLYQVDEGYMVYQIKNVENFRAFISTNSMPGDIDVEFYVSSKDIDELYTPLECKYETGFRTNGWENYVFTPYNPDDIPIGTNYLKIVGKSTVGHNLMLLEGDYISGKVKSQTMIEGDLTEADLTNMEENSDGTLSVTDITKEASMVIPAENMTWFKAGTTASNAIADKLQVSWYVADEADGPFTAMDSQKHLAWVQTSGYESVMYQPTAKTQDSRGKYIKMVIAPIAAGNGTITVDSLIYHQGLVTVALHALKECPDGTTELMDTFETENILVDNGGKAYYEEMMDYGEVTYGYENTTANAIFRIDPDVDCFVVYKTEEPIRYFDVRGLRLTEYTGTNLDFAVSADGENWEWLDAETVQSFVELYEGGKEGVAYQSLTVPEDMYYLRIEIPVLESPQVQELCITGVQIHSSVKSPDTGESAYGWTIAAAVAALSLIVCGGLQKRRETV